MKTRKNYKIISSKIRSFTDLYAWREGHKLVMMVYRVAKKFPPEELFGLSAQIKRSVSSVTSNIAEGFSRQSYKEKVRFYFIAKGSLTETQDQLLTAVDSNYINKSEFKELADQAVIVHKIINGLIKKSKLYYSRF